MTGKKVTLLVGGMIALLYVGAIGAGLRVRDFSLFEWGSGRGVRQWSAPREVPGGKLGESVRRGRAIFNETPLYAAAYTSSRMSCASCHAEGGIQPYASPMVGIPKLFPMFNARAGHVISLKDRVQECFVRSENGKPLDYEGEDMQAVVHYIEWLSKPQVGMRKFVGRGLVELPVLTPVPAHGAAVYAAQCSGCHGRNGEGHANLYPPLWGAESFNDGAGMHGIPKMAAFVQHNMPQNRMGILTPQDAWDVAAFIHGQSRPGFNAAYKHF